MILSAEAVRLAKEIRKSDSESLYLILTDSKKEAYYMVSDLDNFFAEENLYFFPATNEKSEYKKATAQLQRTSAIAAIVNFADKAKKPADAGEASYVISRNIMSADRIKSRIIVTYTEATQESVLRPSKIKASILTLKKGETISHDTISDILLEEKFRKVDFVTEPGEFALRGGIVDIFSYSDEYPFRIDFFGDQIETIKHFNTDSQLSLDELEEACIYPNLDSNFQKADYVSFMDILPQDTQIVDLRLESSREKAWDNISPQPAFNKNFELLSNDISVRQADDYRVIILSPNDSQTRRLKELLSKLYVEFLPVSLHEGYIDHTSKTCYYTDHQIFERYHKLKVHRQVERSERMTINDINALRMGDYIVHIDHGVGQFGGLVKTNVNGRVQEAVKLIYRDGDVIFVSIHSLHRISKYRSRDGEAPKIYKLGSKVWDNLKSNAKKKVKDIAKDLIKLYSERQQAHGFAFSEDSYLQQELESSFIYEDTPDQTKATEAIKADMESLHPMDRLVCGDVGFGKTEVAIRAAFKAVCDSKQVAVLVPTTILCLQHFQTFSQRLKDFPCRVDYISRLRSAAEIKELEKELAQGKIDILIGTHRILNKNIKFKDLGLLVIDEEQKFGVTAKEKIRQMKSSVDTLTLTATPIPRTLQFSLLGARDMSVISTPPPNRHPVSTEVITFDEEYIAQILQREIERGGQVYFVNNKIEGLAKLESIIRRLCPQAEICVAHGQMDPKVLERKMLEFINGDYDILLSTTIIENGIDIPNANTMIVNSAQHFGLSDLHQLRGRVGRSNVKAFCYLIVPELSQLNEEARRRIKALEAFSDLGSGFNIALQDLDIRGAGNLLGSEQSGFMAEMGFETYMRILKEAMNEVYLSSPQEESGEVADQVAQLTVDTQIETDLEVLIPDSYVNVPSEKIRLYREIDAISSEEEIKRFTAGMADRFGSPIPLQLLELMDIVRLRLVAGKLGIERIVLKNNRMQAYFIADKDSWFYKSDTFGAILQKIPEIKVFSIGESNGKLHIRKDNVHSVAEALKYIKLFLV